MPVLRVHVVDRRLRPQPGADDRGPDAAAGRPVRHLQVRRRARPAGGPRDVRPRTTSIFRPHNVYGERQNIADRYRNVIGIFMNQVLQGQPMTVFGDGLQTRAFSHVDDVAPLIARAPLVPAARNRRVQRRGRYAVHRSGLGPRSGGGIRRAGRRSSTCRRGTKCCTPSRTTSRVREVFSPAATGGPRDRHSADGRVGQSPWAGRTSRLFRHRNPREAAGRVGRAGRPSGGRRDYVFSAYQSARVSGNCVFTRLVKQ